MNTITRRHQIADKRAGAMYSGVLISLIAVLVFLITTDVIVIVLGQSSATARAGLLLLLPLVLFIVLYFGKSLRGIVALPEITFLTFLALASFTWSYQPFNTIERAIPLIITTLFSISLASIFSLRNLILIFALVGAISMIVSLLAIATIPGARGIPPWENTWNGIFNHKNGLGANSVFSLIFTLCAVTVTKGNTRRFYGFCAFLAVILLIASESRSPQIVALFSLGAIGSYLLMKRLALVWAVGYFAIIVLFLAFTGYLLSTDVLSPLFEAVDRKPTLSGRLPLWSLMGPYIREEFWIGYGYRAFWDHSSFRIMELSSRLGLGFTPFYSHNGIIEVWLHLGLLGFCVLIAALVRIGRACYVILRKQTDRTAMTAIILIMIAFILMNTTEGSILSRTSLPWMSFVAFSTKACLLASIVNSKPRRVASHRQSEPAPRPAAIEG